MRTTSNTVNKSTLDINVILFDFVHQYFNNNEIRDICFILGIDYDTIDGTTKSDKIREIILYMQRRERIYELEEICAQLRPNIWKHRSIRSEYTLLLDTLSLNHICPPQFAEYILWYLPIDRKTREALTGDLRQEFIFLCHKFDQRKATIWYYYQVSASFWPIIRDKLQKLIKLGIFGWISKSLRHIIS